MPLLLLALMLLILDLWLLLLLLLLMVGGVRERLVQLRVRGGAEAVEVRVHVQHRRGRGGRRRRGGRRHLGQNAWQASSVIVTRNT